MDSADIALALIFAGAFVLGAVWGALRSLVMLAAWFVVFFSSAYLRDPVGRYLSAQWTQFSQDYDFMAAFGILYAAGLMAAIALVWVGMREQGELTRWRLLDGLLSGIVAVVIAVLSVAGTMIILRTYYEPGVLATVGTWTQTLNNALTGSEIGRFIDEQVIAQLHTVLGPFLPADIRSAMA
jgi:hypothetical protein